MTVLTTRGQSSTSSAPRLLRWLLSIVAAVTLLVGCTGYAPQPSPPAPTSEPARAGSRAASSGISISIGHTYYRITGSTANELRAQMDQLGRTDELGYHWDAYTEWQVTWSYPYSFSAGSCSTGPVKVAVDVTFVLPQWDVSPTAPQDLVDKWAEYSAALQVHEDGHKEIATEAGREILDAMNALPAYSSCRELEQAADAVGEGILERYRQREERYDQDTDHGATQGVGFP